MKAVGRGNKGGAMNANELIDELEGYAKARWKPIRDVDNPGYGEDYLVLLIPYGEWAGLKTQIRGLDTSYNTNTLPATRVDRSLHTWFHHQC